MFVTVSDALIGKQLRSVTETIRNDDEGEEYHQCFPTACRDVLAPSNGAVLFYLEWVNGVPLGIWRNT